MQLPARYGLALALLGVCESACGGPARPDPGQVQGDGQAGTSEAPPTFAELAPLLHDKCGSCHHEGGAGPFSLLSYAEVRDHGEQIVEVTASGYMPPWLPEPGTLAFAGEDARRLSGPQRQRLAQWVRAGMPEGEPGQAPAPPRYSQGWSLGEPHAIVRAPAPFMLPAAGKDVYRNFVIPVPAGGARFVKAVELRPGSPRVVHHAVMRVDASGEAERLDARDVEPGFDGMRFGGARMPGGHFIGWTPGKRPDPGSDARAWQLVPGTQLVVQVHMRPSGKVEAVQPQVGLYFASTPPSKPGLAMLLSSSQLDIPAGDADYRVHDSFELPAEVELVSIYPHAHYLAKRMRASARLPGGRELELIRVEDWDFNWQDQYRYSEAITLPAGSVIEMDYSYDNSAQNPRNPASPPRRVVYGPDSTDEMAELILEVEPKDPRDYARLDAAMMAKWLDGQIDAATQALAGDEPSAEALAQLAALLARAGRSGEALTHFEAALAREDSAALRVELALLRHQLGQLEAAAQELDAAQALEPTYARTHLVRGNHAREAEQLAQAAAAYAQALAIDPQLAEAHNNLGVTREKLGAPERAAESFARAAQLVPARALFHRNLGRALEASGHASEALAAYRAALERDARDVRAMRGVAWILATHPEPASRNAREALRIADTAARMTEGRSPEILEALAAALAELDRFDDASRAMKQAQQLAQSAGRNDLAARYAAHMEKLRAQQPLSP